MALRHREWHRTDRIGWLRAAVLGANDGIVSTASLVVGVAAAQATSHEVLVVGVAGLVAGAMSMAAGEYVSVHSQADTEEADLALERHRHAPGGSAAQLLDQHFHLDVAPGSHAVLGLLVVREQDHVGIVLDLTGLAQVVNLGGDPGRAAFAQDVDRGDEHRAPRRSALAGQAARDGRH